MDHAISGTSQIIVAGNDYPIPATKPITWLQVLQQQVQLPLSWLFCVFSWLAWRLQLAWLQQQGLLQAQQLQRQEQQPYV